MESILMFLKPVAEFLAGKLPVLSQIAANGLVAMLAVGLLIEIVEAVAVVTATKKDDAIAAKIKKIKDKVLVVLEVFPHMNVPVVGFLTGAVKLLGKALGVVKALMGVLGKKE